MPDPTRHDPVLPTLLPNAVVAVAERLERHGFEAWLVGESLHTLLTGGVPWAFELATSAPAERSLELFTTAVPTQARHGIVTVPAVGATVDLVPFQRGARLQDDLDHRDFTVLAMAWSPLQSRLFDPHRGHADSTARLLRCVGAARERLHEDPVRALRAARLVAEYGYRVDSELAASLPELGAHLQDVPAARKRSELIRLLIAPRPSLGLSLLRRSGLEQRFVEHARTDAIDLVESLPADVCVRMAGWLVGTRPRATLRALRFGIARSRRVERLLDHHPLDEKVSPRSDRAIGHLLRQLTEEDIQVLFQIREWELARKAEGAERDGAADGNAGALEAALAHKRLDAIRSAIERVIANRERGARLGELALDGRGAMQILGCGPGRRVGAALRFLGDLAAANPAYNTPERLAEELRDWAHRNPEDRNGKSRERKSPRRGGGSEGSSEQGSGHP